MMPPSRDGAEHHAVYADRQPDRHGTDRPMRPDAATLGAGNYSLSDTVNGDSITLSDPTSGTYATPNVGSGIDVAVAGLTLGGANAGDYQLAASSINGDVGSITPATLTYDATAASQVYGNGNTGFSGTVTGFVDGQTLATATTGTAAFASTTSATTNVGSYAIDGAGLTADNGVTCLPRMPRTRRR